jgi:hypothetical protein
MAGNFHESPRVNPLTVKVGICIRLGALAWRVFGESALRLE